jgi:choline monooxygenase
VAPYRIGDLCFGRRIVYDIACNWKVYVENFLEGYHVPSAHPGLHRAIDYRRYHTRVFDTWSVQVAPRRGGAPERTRAGLAVEYAAASHWCWVYPNLMLNMHAMGISTNQILPLGPDRCRTVFDFYWDDLDPAGLTPDQEEDVAISDAIQQEDIVLCEAVQRGLASRAYDSGTFCKAREVGVYRFQRLIAPVHGLV